MRRARRAHPRSRGENLLFDNTGKDLPGSSPLTRGKPAHRRRSSPAAGLIPAHAGKTRCRRVICRLTPAHPRSRGENLDAIEALVSEGGSSPLTRGKRSGGVETKRGARLIPAHAGKTMQPATSEQIDAAHPRSRGENPRLSGGRRQRRGSSPLTRGKPSPARICSATWGLIPAHAGKTLPVGQ